jgi:predicted RecB family nuclease
MQITENLFLAHCQCTYKAFLKSKGEAGEVVDYEAIQTEADAKYRADAIERKVCTHAGGRVLRDPPSLELAVKQGIWLILGARVEVLDVALRFDLIERHDDQDGDEQAPYIPVQFSPRNKLTREDSLLAAFYGIILADALGRPVPFVKVVHSADFSVTRIKLVGPSGATRLVEEARQILGRLRQQVETTSPPLMVLNSHCPSCEFRHRCRTEAVSRDDLSLMRGMSEKEILAQRKHGITSVTQFACTFRPKSIGPKRSKPLKRHLHALQALAVRDKKVYVVRVPEIPAAATRVYLDVEGIPDRDFYYLVGVVVERDGECSAHSFWTDDEAGERVIWVKLLNLLRTLGDWTLFHYGSYEKAYIKKMLRRYPSPDAPPAGAWDSEAFNVLGAIRTNVYFPVYSNGLKDVASYLGATWDDRIASGVDCITFRLRWEESKDPLLQREIVEYNQRDCLAVRRVAHFLSSLGSTDGTATSQVQAASEIRVDSRGRFGSVTFAIPEMDFINKCARFNYQRNKVLLRTDPAVRASVRRKRAKSRPIRKANVEVRCDRLGCCPACGANQITSVRSNSYSKLVYDLKFTRNGIKRWVVPYVSARNHCLKCRKSFYSDPYPTNDKIGHALASWAVYQHVALRQSFDDVASSMNDIFGYCFSGKIGQRAQTRLAESYRATVDKMLEHLRAGMLIHADETKVKLKHLIHGHVWALTGTEIVVYLYHPTREGTFLTETIQDFAGVLVSDFYSAYDSVTCHQQKCHLHLMRDLNDDLLQHPFDEELKELARRYTLTLKPMVETIDKHGLRTKFLSKHKRDAEAFLNWVAKQEVTSEVAQGYKSRIEKYGARLFTFLDHDGIPWNNNNAENALKLVASRRRLFGTSVSEAGLKDYLVFLSIYQTLRRKGISLLRFLLSGETDLEKFLATYRRR